MLIQEYLKQNNLTQRGFADKIGCTTAFLNAILNGKNTDIKISLLRKISSATSLSEPELITELLAHKKPFKGGSKKRADGKPKKLQRK